MLSFALGCAEQTENWPLRAEVLSDMTTQAIWTGRPDEALTLAEQSLVRPDRLTATMMAMLHTDRAHALAKMHRVQEALRAIGTADEYFAHSTPDNDPPFMAFYHAAVYAGHTGRPLLDLAILSGDSSEATDRLTAAAEQLTGYVRARATCLAKLASLTMATGDPLQAATIGHEGLEAPAASTPAWPARHCANCPATPPRTSTGRRSATCGSGSPPCCAPRIRGRNPP